ncbi:Polyketide synthase enoylreductase [Penicillium argentinense]|uniref:Polyketide synthase enoylreductase n=1 Tax=Penicillium argentinense TaxID=1131581 RepID=A0A9W9K2H3_9EURO|nr:Polyketide synthase enoylreductase [Penicillium argentinense]KAJ5089732.1 Polyketide synthase enoylreductase [Penicillium argentinense]
MDSTHPPVATSAHPTSMKAWLYNGTSGGLEKNMHLEYSARAPPVPRANEVLIQVLSAGLNPADFKVPEMGIAARRLVIGMPATPGMDFCGRVVSTGPSATHFPEGQLVYGCHSRPVQFGSLGEYLLVPATFVRALPDNLGADQIAGIGIAGQSAYQSLHGYVKQGDKVFINGGSGGCGLYAIQIAKHMGCHVTVTCSTKNVELCYRMGADDVIDYTAEEDLVAGLQRRGVVYDHVLDHIGLPSPLYYQSHHFLKPDGVFVQVGASSIFTFAGRVGWPSLLGGGKRKYVIFFFKNTGEHLAKLGKMMEEGSLKTQVDSTYEFEDAVQAFERLRSGRARGKIIVHVAKPKAHWSQEVGLF